MRNVLLAARSLHITRDRIRDRLESVDAAPEHSGSRKHHAESRHRLAGRPAATVTGTADVLDADTAGIEQHLGAEHGTTLCLATDSWRARKTVQESTPLRRQTGPMNDAVMELLPADGPDPDLGDAADLYGRLIGSWDIDNRESDESTGEWHRDKRECHVRWVLGGRVVQDLWGSPERGFGTTVRAYDAELGAWRVHWFAPYYNGFCVLTGSPDGDRIRQEGTQQDGRPIRWSIVDITPDTFTWRGEISDDGGKTWRLEQEMKGTRRT